MFCALVLPSCRPGNKGLRRDSNVRLLCHVYCIRHAVKGFPETGIRDPDTLQGYRPNSSLLLADLRKENLALSCNQSNSEARTVGL